MALQIPSGLITSISGTLGAIVSFPMPVVLVGAGGASASGNRTITENSGALNVNISGGSLATLMSGVAVSVSGNAVAIFGYTPTLVSGAVLVNVQSGRSLLHSIVINSYSSGGQFEVHNSLSGIVAANIIATISPTVGSVTNADISPSTLTYDAIMTSGIVISTSGANWNLTVNYKNPA